MGDGEWAFWEIVSLIVAATVILTLLVVAPL